MFTRPRELGDEALAGALGAGWGITVDAIEYVPVGFGSHHWSVSSGTGRWFVSVDDLDAKRHGPDDPRDAAWSRLSSVLSAARAVADRGLDFVVAPIQAADGTVVRRVDDRFAVAMYPFLDGTSYGFGRFPTVEHRDAVLEMVAQLHGVAEPASLGAARDTFAVPQRADLATAIGELATRWETGPYGEPARQLLERHVTGTERMLGHHDRLAARLASEPEPMVLTHGEPHAGNTIGSGGTWWIVDWDTTLIAAPERDLWMMADADPSVLDTYAAITGRRLRADGLDCYRLWWDLSEICGAIALFRQPHDDNDDTRLSWKILRHYLDANAGADGGLLRRL